MSPFLLCSGEEQAKPERVRVVIVGPDDTYTRIDFGYAYDEAHAYARYREALDPEVLWFFEFRVDPDSGI